MLSNLVSRLAYAALAGIIAFLIVLGLGELIVHLFNAANDFGSRVEGFSVVIGFLVAIVYFFRQPQVPPAI